MESEMTTMRWILSLFFAKGMPRVVVFIISLLMLWQLKFDALQMMFCVALFYVPWALKRWWASVVDSWLTHRQWILLSELLLVLLFGCMAKGLGNNLVVIILLFLIALVSAIHNAAADRYARLHEQTFRHAIAGELSRKFSQAVGQGVLVMLVGNLQVFFRYDLLYSWRVMYYIVAGLFLFLFFWHFVVLKAPERKQSQNSEDFSPSEHDASLAAIPSYLLVFFLMTYPLAQQMAAKASILFLVDSRNNGGLGLSPQEFALVMGTLGITGLTVGALWGRTFIKGRIAIEGLSGLRSYQRPIFLSMFVPTLVYALLSYFQSTNLLLTCMAVTFEQLAFGFGFAFYLAFVKCLPHIERFKSLMAHSMILSCLLTGVLLDAFDYFTFFCITFLLSLLTPLSVKVTQKENR